jgi:hypothetical protein
MGRHLSFKLKPKTMYRTIDQLTEDEFLELSDREGITINQLKDEFSSTLFVEEDFFCNL